MGIGFTDSQIIAIKNPITNPEESMDPQIAKIFTKPVRLDTGLIALTMVTCDMCKSPGDARGKYPVDWHVSISLWKRDVKLSAIQWTRKQRVLAFQAALAALKGVGEQDKSKTIHLIKSDILHLWRPVTEEEFQCLPGEFQEMSLQYHSKRVKRQGRD